MPCSSASPAALPPKHSPLSQWTDHIHSCHLHCWYRSQPPSLLPDWPPNWSLTLPTPIFYPQAEWSFRNKKDLLHQSWYSPCLPPWPPCLPPAPSFTVCQPCSSVSDTHQACSQGICTCSLFWKVLPFFLCKPSSFLSSDPRGVFPGLQLKVTPFL